MSKRRSESTMYVLKRVNAWDRIAQTVDVFGSTSLIDLEVTSCAHSFYLDDESALEADWTAVGNDLRTAFVKFEDENRSGRRR